jgi:hypothetical protein
MKYYHDGNIKEYGRGRVCCRMGEMIQLTENFKLENQTFLRIN